MTKPVKKPRNTDIAPRVTTTDAEIDAAIARASVREDSRPYVVGARYRVDGDAVVLSLATGVEVAIPRRLLQGLQGVTAKELEAIKIEGPGTGLHWPALEVDHYVPALLAGVLGTRHWLRTAAQPG